MMDRFDPGGTDLERGMGMRGHEDPLFTPLLQFARVPFQAKESVHKTPFWENLKILASTASNFRPISALKPPNWKIFSSQALQIGNFQFTSTLFQRQISVRKPHTSESRAAHPYLKKKVECPSRGVWSSINTNMPSLLLQMKYSFPLQQVFLIPVVEPFRNTHIFNKFTNTITNLDSLKPGKKWSSVRMAFSHFQELNLPHDHVYS